MNWPILIVVGIILLALIIFMVVRNFKDEEEFEEHAHGDYSKPHHHDTDAEETPK